MKKILFVIMKAFLVQFGNAQIDSIDYFGQTPPGDSAVIFAPGIISLPDRKERKIAFSPDGKECYFHASGTNNSGIYYTKYENNSWIEQKEASFSIGHRASLPFFSADGNKLYFGIDYDIYMVEREAEPYHRRSMRIIQFSHLFVKRAKVGEPYSLR